MKDNIVSKQSLLFFETSGFSMFPVLKTNDKIIVKSTDAKDIIPGDIILFYNDGRNYCHRLIKKNWKAGKIVFYTRGDSYFKGIETVQENMILGKVMAVKRGNKIIATGNLRSRLMDFLLVVVYYRIIRRCLINLRQLMLS